MCGHAGMVRLWGEGLPTHSDLRLFQNLFITSQLRGPHSSGVSALWRQQPKQKGRRNLYGWKTEKGCMSPLDAYHSVNFMVNAKAKKKEETHDVGYYQALLGHSRHATIGKVNPENAHPFAFANNRFIGAHNGTIYGSHRLWTRLHEDKVEPRDGTVAPTVNYADEKLEVTDSERVLYAIYRYGIEAVYPRIHGAWAFVYYDQLTTSIYFIRNRERTLCYYWDPNDDSMFYSSEREMLEFGVGREKNGRQKATNIKMFPTDELFRLDLSKSRRLTHNMNDVPWTSQERINSVLPFTGPVRAITAFVGDTRKPSGQTMNGNAGKTTEVLRDTIAKPAKSLHFSIDTKRDILIHKEKKDCECIWCSSTLNHAVENIAIGKEGHLCPMCYADLSIMNEIVEMYPSAGDNPMFMRTWLELAQEKYEENNVA